VARSRVTLPLPMSLVQNVSELYSSKPCHFVRVFPDFVTFISRQRTFSCLLMFCWPCISVQFQKLTNLMHKFLFYNKCIICLHMFRALCAHHQEVKIVLYSIWYCHTLQVAVRCAGWEIPFQPFLSQPVHRMATYRCDDTRCCIIQFQCFADRASQYNLSN